MKISAEILVRDLKKKLPVKVLGTPSSELALKRVELYEPTREQRPGFVSVTDAYDPENLPRLPKDSLLILVGGQVENLSRRHSRLYTDRGAVVLVESGEGLAPVFNAVQEVFDFYSEWNEKLQEILQTTNSLKEMVEVSTPVFDNPIGVCDQNLKVLVSSEKYPLPKDSILRLATGDAIHFPSAESSRDIRAVHAANKMKRKPFFHNNKQCYCINLFVGDSYSGLVSLGVESRPFDNADLVLFGHFADLLLKAYKKYSTLLRHRVVNLRSVVLDIISGVAVSQPKINQAVGILAGDERFICILLNQASAAKALPAEYLCNLVESHIPGCIALEYDSAMVILLRLKNYPLKFNVTLQALVAFLEENDFIAGISSAFTDIAELKSYLKQASIALDVGPELDTERSYYRFADYALPYVVKLAAHELEPRFYLPSGLLRLKEHDSRGMADYWETLRVYLENEMNASETARALNLHRSTLHQRLTRIGKILDVDLENHQARLYVELCIYLVDLQEKNGIA